MRPAALGLALAILALPAAGWAQSREVISPAPEKTALAIYPDPQGTAVADLRDPDTAASLLDDFGDPLGLVLVTEWRTIELPAGESRIRFQGVAEGIVAETAAVDGLPATLVERNQDFELLGRGSLIARSIGQEVTWVQSDRKTGRITRERAIIRSGPNGVVLEVNGRFETLHCGGGWQSLVFDKAPPGLTDRPTLSIVVRAKEAGRHRVRLSYLATGVLWSADYVAHLDPAGETLELTGWITLANTTGTSFENAPTAVVAGDLEVDDDTRPVEVSLPWRDLKCWPSDTTTKVRRPFIGTPIPVVAADSLERESDVAAVVITGSRIPGANFTAVAPIVAEQSDLGDYKLYTLPSPTTVAANQTKQVLMVSRQAVKYRRLYVFSRGVVQSVPGNREYDEEVNVPLAATAMLSTRNTRANGLGLALPGGHVVVTEPYGGQSLIGGGGRMFNIPVDQPIEIPVAPAVDVQVFTAMTDDVELESGVRRSYEVVITNAKPEAVDFEFRLRTSNEAYRITKASPGLTTGPTGPVWKLRLPPNGRRVLKYTGEVTY